LIHKKPPLQTFRLSGGGSSENEIQDVSPILNFDKLERLIVSGNPISNMDVLDKFIEIISE